MKKDRSLVWLAVFMAVCLLASIPFIVDDAIHGRGFFMSTATYREIVKQGK